MSNNELNNGLSELKIFEYSFENEDEGSDALSGEGSSSVKIGCIPRSQEYYNKDEYLELAVDMLIDNENINLIMPEQMHSNEVIEVTEENIEEDLQCDAIFTKLPNICLCIESSDCLPIHFVSKKHNIVGLIHAGWRSLVSGLIQNTFEKIGNLEDLSIMVGPCISAENYEIKKDLVEELTTIDKIYLDYIKNVDGKYFFDIKNLGIDIIKSCNYQNIYDSDINTYNDDKFISYRKQKQLDVNTESYMTNFISFACRYQDIK